METKFKLIFNLLLLISLLKVEPAIAQEFNIDKISHKIFAITNQSGGEDQLILASDKGMVVINSFWSEIIAKKFKNEIVKSLKRDDFIYTINMVDRLDMFGGNATYKETTIIGHQAFLEKYKGKEKEVDTEIKRLIKMWRWKEDVSRKRLEKHKTGSKRAINEKRWMNTCKQRADELENGFSLVLPNIGYKDRIILELGDLSLNLIYFGKAGYNGMSLIHIPEERLAIIPGFIMHSQHLAPHPQNRYAKLDVPRWIKVLEELLEGENSVKKVICDINEVWTKERAQMHLVYIRKLWSSVKNKEAAGISLEEIQDQLSLENDFKFVKEMQVYKDGGDDWIRPQHRTHVRLFYLQHKNLASEIIKEEMDKSSFQDALIKVKKLQANGSDIYFDESFINNLGYNLLNSDKISEAIEIFKFNVELFPESPNVYDSLAETYMKNGDKKLAAKNYTKAVELNPKNENAKKMLEKLKHE